ncbi:MAG: sporulation protein [Clostridiales bacterium]|nr:sporulation protein [Clostridiales bacterium]
MCRINYFCSFPAQFPEVTVNKPKTSLKRKLYDVIICLALLSVMTALVIFPQQSVKAGGDGVKLCLNVIIPSLFPFFVISSLVIELGIAAKLGRFIEPIMSKLFRVNGACSAAFVLGFIGGYPVGAKTAITLYEKGQCSKLEAERLLSFCNNSGPAFILGVVGAGVFSNSIVGLLLYLAHTAASVVIGILFRNWGDGGSYADSSGPYLMPGKNQKAPGFASAFTIAVKNAFQTTLNICGFVIFFTVIIRLLFIANIIPAVASVLGGIFSPFGFNQAAAERLLTGLIELTSGVWTLQNSAAQLTASAAMAAFMLGWAGLSIHCQALSFLCDSGLSAKTYIIGKFLHGILSAALVYFIVRLFLIEAPVSSYLAEQVTGMTGMGFFKSLILSTGCAFLLLFCLTLFSRAISSHTLTPNKTTGKKSGKSVEKSL